MTTPPKPIQKTTPSDNPAGPEAGAVEWLRVAHIVRPQGRSGEVVAELLTDFPERFQAHTQVHLCAPGQSTPFAQVVVDDSRLHSGRIVLKLQGYDTMNDAEALRAHDVVVPWAERMPLADDEIYIADLVGASLVDRVPGARRGTIVGVDRESSNTCLLVVESGSQEVLVPFVKAYGPQWDAASRMLSMDLPSGLFDPDQAE